MGIELGKAWVRIRGDSSGLKGDLNQAKGRVEAVTRSMSRGIGGMIAPIIGVTTSMGTMIKALMSAAKFEQTKIAFGALIGNVKETQKTLADLTTFAALTPFEMPEIEQAARGLLTFGERGQELMDTLKILGDVSSGTSTSFGFLALVFNQVRGVGKLLSQDFKQLSTRGIISLQDIADYFKVTTQEADKMKSAGKISFDDLKAILKGLTSEGGRFYNMMENQSKSLLGLWSTLKDAMDLVTRAIGEGLMPVVKPLVVVFIQLVEVTRTWVEAHKTLAGMILLSATAVTVLTGAFMALAIAVNLAGGFVVIGPAIAAIAVFTALGAAVGMVVKWLSGFVTKLTEVKGSVHEAFFGEAIENFKSAWISIKNAVNNVAVGLLKLGAELLKFFGIAVNMDEVEKSFGEWMLFMIVGISEVVEKAAAWMEVLTGNWELAFELMKLQFKVFRAEVQAGFVDLFVSIIQTILAFTTTFGKLISDITLPSAKGLFDLEAEKKRIKEITDELAKKIKEAREKSKPTPEDDKKKDESASKPLWAPYFKDVEEAKKWVEGEGKSALDKFNDYKKKLLSTAFSGMFGKDFDVGAKLMEAWKASPMGAVADKLIQIHTNIQMVAAGFSTVQIRIEDAVKAFKEMETATQAMTDAFREQLKIQAFQKTGKDIERMIDDLLVAQGLMSKTDLDMKRFMESNLVRPGQEAAVRQLFEMKNAGAGQKKEDVFGRMGFAQYANKIQDAVLKKDDPQKKLVTLSTNQLTQLKTIDASVKALDGGLL